MARQWSCCFLPSPACGGRRAQRRSPELLLPLLSLVLAPATTEEQGSPAHAMANNGGGTTNLVPWRMRLRQGAGAPRREAETHFPFVSMPGAGSTGAAWWARLSPEEILHRAKSMGEDAILQWHLASMLQHSPLSVSRGMFYRH
jgi:hypothetical protein